MANKVIPVKVAVRCRPFSEKEKAEGSQNCVKFYVEHNQLAVGEKMFAYDFVFDQGTSQDDVYEQCALPLLESMFKGYHATIFAYGQTGSGKTHTMGTEVAADTMTDQQRGIIPRIVQAIFDRIAAQTTDQVKYTASCSMLEIYEERVIDLLSGSKSDNLPIREADGKVFVQDLSNHAIADLRSTIGKLTIGCENRSKGGTAMNLHSSRSHAIFTLTVNQTVDGVDDKTNWIAKLNLVDLAGSERLKKTQASGERKKEGIKINEGLLALGNVISALTEPSGSGVVPHVPYRNSKLTRLLCDSLGGSSHTLMIACISPADTNCEETLSTLRYAERAKRIKNKPIINQDPQAAQILKLKHEVAELKRELALRGGSQPSSAQVVEVDLAKYQVQDELNELKKRCTSLEHENEEMQMKMIEEMQQRMDLTQQLATFECRRDQSIDVVKDIESKLKPYLCEQPECNGCDDKVITIKSVHAELPKIFEEHEQDDQEQTAAQMMSRIARTMSTTSAAGDESTDEDDDVTVTATDKEHKTNWVERTSALTTDLQSVLKDIRCKEQLAEDMANAYERQEQLSATRQKEVTELQQQIDRLQSERDELNRQLRMISNQKKLSEDRRKRLQELEKQLADNRKKIQELRNLEKTKLVNEKEITRLRAEIQDLRAARVRFMKELRAENEKFRKWQQKQQREITQLKMKEKKTVYEAQRQKQTAEKQLQVFRQKYEEAISCNNKLKRLLERVDSVRSQKFNEQKLNKDIKYFLDQEFDVVASTEEARIHCENLISQRTDLTRQLKRAERRLDRLEKASQSSAATEDGATEPIEAGELRAQIKNMKNEIELRNSEIAELQERIVAFDAKEESKEEQRWASIRTLTHGKCALKLLFDMTVEERVTSMQDKAALAEVQSQINDLMESNKQRSKEKKEVEKAMQQQVTVLEKRIDSLQSTHQKQMAFLLTQLCASLEGKKLDAGAIEKIMSIKDQLHGVDKLYLELEEKDQENKRISQQLNRAGGKARLFRRISSTSQLHDGASSSGYVQPILPIQKTRSARLSKPPQRYGNSVLAMSPVLDNSQSGADSMGEENQAPAALNASDVNDSDYINTPARARQMERISKGHKRAHDDHSKGANSSSESITDDKMALNATFVKDSDVSSDREQIPSSSTESATRRPVTTVLNETYNADDNQEPDQAADTTEPPPKKALAYAPNNSASDDEETPITSKGIMSMKRPSHAGGMFKSPYNR